MPENPELLAAIVAHPREDTPRLAYADWLDDHGDTDRARFIRIQYEIEKLPPIGAKASKAKKEEEALLKKHETRWLGELAYLHSGVRVSFTPFGGAREDFCFADGTREYVRALVGAEKVVHADPIVLRGEADGVCYEVGLQWCADDERVIASYVNERFSVDGGTHVAGMYAGARRVVLPLVRERISKEIEVQGDDVHAGMCAVVAVRLADPMFFTALRDKLVNPEAEGIIASAVRAGLSAHFDAHPADAEAIARHIARAAEVRIAAQKARRAKRSGA